MKPVDQLKLLQALNGLSRAMGKIRDCMEEVTLPKDHPNSALYHDLANLCLTCASMSMKVADEFLKGKPTHDLSLKTP